MKKMIELLILPALIVAGYYITERKNIKRGHAKHLIEYNRNEAQRILCKCPNCVKKFK